MTNWCNFSWHGLLIKRPLHICTKAQQALKNSTISVNSQEHFQDVFPGRKPSWITAPTMALLKTLAVEIDLIETERDHKNKSVRSKIDLLHTLEANLS